MAHVRYIERDAAGVDENDVELFSADGDKVDGQVFAYDAQHDRHHFRLTINPEDGRDLPDLKSFTREVMSGIEQDMDALLDWIAGIHHDTGRPHAHIVIRGRQTGGHVFKMPRDYISYGIRDRAQALATRELGPRPARTQEHLVRQDRYTPLDRLLLESSTDNRLYLRQVPPLSQSDALRRLVHLETKGWATREAAGVWQISPTLRRDLTAAKETASRDAAAGKIIARSEQHLSPADLVAVEPTLGGRLTGKYVGTQFVGPFAGGANIVVLQLEGDRLGHIRMPTTRSVLLLDQLPEGAIVQLQGWPRETRPSDVTIAEIAGENGGIWSAEIHKRSRPDDNPPFIQSHLKRADAMARERVCSQREDGTFQIPPTYGEDALANDIKRWGPATPQLVVHDHRPLEEQVRADGVTWLDRKLLAEERPSFGGKFGQEVEAALTERTALLKRQGLMSPTATRLTQPVFDALLQAEVSTTIKTLGVSGKAVFAATAGDRISGVYREKIHIQGMPFAVLESPSAVTMVRWEASLEAGRGKEIVGVLGQGGLEFRTARALGRGIGLSL